MKSKGCPQNLKTKLRKGFVTHNDILRIYRTITIKKYFQNILKLFLLILEINVFQNKNQSYQKKKKKSAVIFPKMADIDNNKLMGLLIIAEGGLLLSQEYIK